MKKTELRIINSKLLVGDSFVEAGIAVENGKIAKVAKEPNLPSSDSTIDAKGLVMLPGIVDVHVHLRDMDLSYKEDFSSGTQAAVMGGITTVLDMPNTSPPTTDAQRLREKIDKASHNAYCNIGFFGALALEPRETAKMVNEGAIGFKLYLNDPKYIPLNSEALLTEVLKPIKQADSVLAVHAELPQEQVGRSNPTSLKNEIEQFLKSHDPQLEFRAVSKCIDAAKKTGVHVHLCHVTTGVSLTMIKKEKLKGVPITAEATPHHLLLSKEALYQYGAFAKMVPPLRNPSDVHNLIQGLANGDLDAVASDHAPHSIAEKNLGFTDAPSGVPGLETMLPLLLTEMSQGRVSLTRIVATMCENPPRLFRIGKTGRISEGTNADIVLIDLRKEKMIDSRTFVSKAKFTPFEGRRVRGIPVMTIVNGTLVMQDRNIIGKPGVGRIIRPSGSAPIQ